LTTSASPSIDIVIESALWAGEPAAEAVVRDAIATAAAVVRAAPGRIRPVSAGEVSVVLTDDDAIRRLNRAWRRIDKPTNVLSFPAAKLPAAKLPMATRSDPGSPLLGDIIIAYETTAHEAAAEAKSFAHHVAHLAVHGFLHLLGYDHDSDEEAEEMERLEARILARLDVPDPHMTCGT
jgi:probable rRNA maturation factor